MLTCTTLQKQSTSPITMSGSHTIGCPFTSQVDLRLVSLPDLTHSSVNKLLAASLHCDSDTRCSAFMSETQCTRTPDIVIEHWSIWHWWVLDKVPLLWNSDPRTVQIRKQHLSGSDINYMQDTLTATLERCYAVAIHSVTSLKAWNCSKAVIRISNLSQLHSPSWDLQDVQVHK